MKIRELDMIPDRLFRALRDAPLIAEDDIDRYVEAGCSFELMPSEIDMLRCLSHGMDMSMTAVTLGVSAHTVKNQLRTARFKLRAKDSTHAVAVALRQGIIT